MDSGDEIATRADWAQYYQKIKTDSDIAQIYRLLPSQLIDQASIPSGLKLKSEGENSAGPSSPPNLSWDTEVNQFMGVLIDFQCDDSTYDTAFAMVDRIIIGQFQSDETHEAETNTVENDALPLSTTHDTNYYSSIASASYPIQSEQNQQELNYITNVYLIPQDSGSKRQRITQLEATNTYSYPYPANLEFDQQEYNHDRTRFLLRVIIVITSLIIKILFHPICV